MSEQQQRQQFLKDPKGGRLRGVRVAVVGLGGGGSQVTKYLAMAGCTTLTLFDRDRVKGVNSNRTDGLTQADLRENALKVAVANRTVLQLAPHADTRLVDAFWEDAIDELVACDIIVGCIDTFSARRDLERAARQQLSPYVDIGLDIHRVDTGRPQMAGQVILSMPGGHCMTCMGFLTEKKLAAEASNYGGNRGREQVGWGNGVLAATAAGVVVDLITGWTGSKDPLYLQYDGNKGTVTPHARMQYLPERCVHFTQADAGPPRIVAV